MWPAVTVDRVSLSGLYSESSSLVPLGNLCSLCFQLSGKEAENQEISNPTLTSDHREQKWVAKGFKWDPGLAGGLQLIRQLPRVAPGSDILTVTKSE